MTPFRHDRLFQVYQLTVAIALALGSILVLLLLQMLLPWLLIGGGILIGAKFWQRQHQHQQLLYAIFYDHLRQNQGRLSVLEFAMAAQIPGRQARKFLDAQAQAFFAQFEPTASGDVIYTFQLPQTQNP